MSDIYSRILSIGSQYFDIKNKTICIKVLCKYNEHEKQIFNVNGAGDEQPNNIESE